MADAVDRRVIKLCRHLAEHPAGSFALADMGRLVGLSPSHLQRRFTELVGVSPREFHERQRLHLFKTGLRSEARVIDALAAAGYASSSRMHARVRRDLGMKPSEYQKGGAGIEVVHAHADTALGSILIGATERGLCFLQFGEDRSSLIAALAAEFPNARLKSMPRGDRAAFAAWMAPLRAYLAGEPSQLSLPLDLRGTAFQLEVWRYLQQIPAGETRTYAQVAAGIGRNAAVRAVASACARNRVALLVPCHRVIRADGGLGGFRWGLSRKRALLQLESHAATGAPS